MESLFSGSRQRDPGAAAAEEPLYKPDFVRILVIHFLVMGSVAIYYFLPRYIRLDGGNEFLIGLIMGAPFTAAVLLRLPAGSWIDRFGKRNLISRGLLAFAVTSALPVLAQGAGVYLFAVRALAGGSVTLYFTASVTFVADTAPAKRRAEAIAVYGAAGFMAQALVPFVAEWLLGVLPFAPVWNYRALFGLAALCGALSAAISLSLGPDAPRPEGIPAPDPWHRVIRNRTMLYLFIPSLVFGAGYASIFNFVTDFTQVKHIGAPSWFFISYSMVIFLLRLTTGRVIDRVDRRLGVVFSLSCLALGLMYASFSTRHWDLLVIGMLTGVGHCYIFPTLSSLTYDSSPVHNRGTSMALYMLGSDLSAMLVSPVLGRVAEVWDYYVMYRISAFLILAGLAFYATGWRHHHPRAVRRSARGRNTMRSPARAVGGRVK
ncbi:MFS transporter [bacterium]|nr:MFS transporter [bacterium]